MGWRNGHEPGLHDHNIASGAVAVVQGEAGGGRRAPGGAAHARVYGRGEAFDFGASDIHRMSHAGGGPAISIHAYSPPLWRMGAYAIDDEGLVSRTSISYAEELRPLEAAG